MGRKAKVGKSRKDRFYRLAKETGYRARSAFKLIQLNRKFHFLQSSRVLVDLCAAPGGWLQVAATFMPISSLIIGIDLVPIKNIPNVITFQQDITTAKCKQQLQRELKSWKVDCMLNDGAPNVGAAWVHDAFSQAELTLSAVKLASEFLKEGGWFITKVFRSKDYQPLMWVLQQLFKKVNATKPQASRLESAEIFVVCQGYLAPSKVDPKLLDPRYVFKELEEDTAGEHQVNLSKIQKPAKAEGYPDNTSILYKTGSVADFITGDNYLQLLNSVNKLEFDKTSDVFAKHPLTTDEIRTSCEDIKVLGPGELKQLVKWRNKLRKFLDTVDSDNENVPGEGVMVEGEGPSDAVLEKTDEKIKQLEMEEAAEVKRERRRLRQQKKKLKERLIKKGTANDEAAEIIRQDHLFRLKDIKTLSALEEVNKGDMMDRPLDASESEDEFKDVGTGSEGSDISDDNNDESAGEGLRSDGDQLDSDSESEEEENAESTVVPEELGNPLIVTLEEGSTAPRLRRTDLWFSKPEFKELQNDQDDDIELQQMVENYKQVSDQSEANQQEMNRPVPRGQKIGRINSKLEATKIVDPEQVGAVTESQNEKSDVELDSHRRLKQSIKMSPVAAAQNLSSDCSDDRSSSSDDETYISKAKSDHKLKIVQGDSKPEDVESLEVVPAGLVGVKRRLDAEGLAMGTLLIQSKKKREELVDSGYNRWTSNDDNLPDWFVQDEAKFCTKQIPISKEMVDIYRAKLKDINSRPINKVAEAKARKKKRVLRKLEKVRKKTEVITDAADVSSNEKAQQLKHVYKKAGLADKKKEVKYVVAKKGTTAKRFPRPAGVKGHYKVVDPRMKKDNKGKQKKTPTGQRRRKQ